MVKIELGHGHLVGEAGACGWEAARGHRVADPAEGSI
jgi:hypothetical protein